MYVAVKGGEKAIAASHALQAKKRRGDTKLNEISIHQIEQQLSLAVDRVMTEGGIYDRQLAALALKQACGDQVEAIFLVRAYRTTLAHIASCEPLDCAKMLVERRISAIYKDLPGGQQLGASFDYNHRLLDFSLMAESEPSNEYPIKANELEDEQVFTKVFSLLEQQGLAKSEQSREPSEEPLTTSQSFPYSRVERLAQLTRSDEGFLLALAYSTQRGYGRNHPFAGEIRTGFMELELEAEELGFSICIGQIQVTECEMVNGFVKPEQEQAHFTRGYGLSLGAAERKAMAIALIDRSLQASDYGEAIDGPAQDEEFVLAHGDNVEAAGFVSHLKLPHYVDFQAELELIRKMRNTKDTL
ncbi:carbon-phosphorus lyase complex subunit PhnI [Alginatibacterium sediminis]|uniref:Carbon-phosphorus lyase complex subunit PhnI n=1 Tax=Alginatibacterium sediminis TaxID=2164068 RepID=A0A420EL79_9ALTE|nr:carbon-phosphorus lyase complex subunit PhnI [Alginatibacterium sediminis]RKF21433.1 carbon-phosphorus lyase complex subunit PhnI [Alginatibacterium sediminis]